MYSIVHLTPATPGDDLRGPGSATLEVLSQRPGFVRGDLARATDDVDAWVLVTEWESVGAYRRALGSTAVKMVATPLFHLAVDAPSGFESLVSATPGHLRELATEVVDGVH